MYDVGIKYDDLEYVIIAMQFLGSASSWCRIYLSMHFLIALEEKNKNTALVISVIFYLIFNYTITLP